MACLKSQKLEIELLQQIFPKDHNRFQLLNCNPDDLRCRFIDGNGKHYDIQASITVTYPMTPPIWYSECDDAKLSEIMQELGNSQGEDNHLVLQVASLVRKLCDTHNVPLPDNMEKLTVPMKPQNDNDGDERAMELEIIRNAYKILILMLTQENDVHGKSDDDSMDSEKTSSKDEEEGKLRQTLQKLNNQQDRQDQPQGLAAGSPNAVNRLMKELRLIYHSDTFKQNVFSLDLDDDSIYNWNVSLHSVDKDSRLYADMLKLKEIDGEGAIKLQFRFNDNYPSSPPFVRVVYPAIMGSFVLFGGAICMQLLTNSGWTSAYTIESLIIQISVALSQNDGRIFFGISSRLLEKAYNLEYAQRNFQLVQKMHNERGWSQLDRPES
ncbi:ubiquitin-conjugating enzyme E2 Q2-like [Drosophila albomicans]|uniref:Ubiquitin-conjugating enzyme E2 Q2-like n=1 Tax=Drosophila albomicans TaxID=7291 RepID=A0A6P8WPA5_DROAB|nr:ubiquitin-conjugating enzyme E2 Q2-like [Drosophila albomicans]